MERGRAAAIVLEVGALDGGVSWGRLEGAYSEWKDVVGVVGVVDRVVNRPSGCWGYRHHWVLGPGLFGVRLAGIDILSNTIILAFCCEFGSDFAVFRLVELESFPIGLTCTSSPPLSRNADVIPS